MLNLIELNVAGFDTVGGHQLQAFASYNQNDFPQLLSIRFNVTLAAFYGHQTSCTWWLISCLPHTTTIDIDHSVAAWAAVQVITLLLINQVDCHFVHFKNHSNIERAIQKYTIHKLQICTTYNRNRKLLTRVYMAEAAFSRLHGPPIALLKLHKWPKQWRSSCTICSL